jgi:endonuclease YncB( thermonuclease family)
VGAKRLTARVSGAVAASVLLSACGGMDSDVGRMDEPGVVRHVSDGDTLTLSDGRRVRLVQIDAPETGECFAAASTAALTRLTPRGRRVVLARDGDLDERDEHGRLLRYVLGDVEAGPNVNVELVSQGAAVPYFFRGARGVHADELLAAAERARREGRGLWGACPGAKLEPNRGSLTGPA